MSEQARALRQLFDQPGVIRLVGAHNALGARLAERAGFEGVWSSGLEISTSYAVPDANILSMSEFLAAAESMVNAVRIPVVADCDTGYGNSNNVIHMVRRFEGVGVAAVCIEDKKFPKVNSFVPGRQELAPISEFVGKIMAAKNAQCNPEFIVIARIEALIAGYGWEEALRRADAYVEAGADAILIHKKTSGVDPIGKFLTQWDGKAPIVVVPTTYPDVTVTEFEKLGVKMVIYANQGLRAAVRVMEETYRQILETGSTASVEGRMASLDTIFQLQGMPQMKEDEERFLQATKPDIRVVIPAAGDHLDEYSMKHIAADTPMAMLDLNGQPLLQRQLTVLQELGVGDVTVVGGYQREKICVHGVTTVDNPDWQSTGIAESFLVGTDPAPDGRTLMIYSDILFTRRTLESFLDCEEDIVLLVDGTFSDSKKKLEGKLDLVVISEPHEPGRRALETPTLSRVLQIGKEIDPATANGEFVGIAMFSQKGLSCFHRIYKGFTEKRRDASRDKTESCQASFVDVIQELIQCKTTVHCAQISGGWMEIHSFQDYKTACAVLAKSAKVRF